MGHVPFATDESDKTVYLCLGYVRIATQAHLSERIAIQRAQHAGLAVIQRGREGRGADPPAFGY